MASVWPDSRFSVFGGVQSGAIEVAALGDSYVELSYNTAATTSRHDFRGPWHWANQLLGGPMRMRLTAMNGVTGETSAMILARVGNVSNLTPRARYCFFDAGNNDVATGVPTSTTIPNIASIIAGLNSAGMVAITGPVFNRTGATAPQITATAEINAAVSAMAAPGKLIYADYSAGTVDGGTGLTLPNILYDGTHPGARGARIMGGYFATSLASIMRRGAPLAQVVDGANYLLNGTMAGSAAATTNGFTGNSATSWTTTFRNATESAGTKVLSKVARSDIYGEWVQMVWTGVTHTASYNSGITQAITPSAVGLRGGDWVEVLAECEVDAGAVNLAGPMITVLEADGGGTTNQANWLQFQTGGQSQVNTWSGTTRLVIRTPAFQVRPDAGVDTITVRLLLVGQGDEAGGITATARFGRVALRRIG
jgi:lysophospholipase L1-like esterase